jgi:hypothetical protein
MPPGTGGLDADELKAARRLQAVRVQPGWTRMLWKSWEPKYKKPSTGDLRDEVTVRATERNLKLGPTKAVRLPKPTGWTLQDCIAWLEKHAPAFLMTVDGMYASGLWSLILTRRRSAGCYKAQRRRFGHGGGAGRCPAGTISDGGAT